MNRNTSPQTILFHPRRLALAVCATLASLQPACVTPDAVQAENSAVDVEIPSTFDPDRSVCDPFGNTGADRNQGLYSRMYYLTPEQALLPAPGGGLSGTARYTRVDDYRLNGTGFDADLFFSQLNVPTRPFDRGFLTQNGTILTTPAGNTLYEWFSLHFQSVLKLSNQERPSKYQFALLSDDGSNLYVDERGDGTFTKLIDNDGLHPSKLMCSTKTIRFNAGTRLPIKLDYYQGPRFHVALMLLWREIGDDVNDAANPALLSDPACGLSGNDTFFDYNQAPPVASPVWLGMLRRGWRVLSTHNYQLPGTVSENPCGDGNGGGGPGEGLCGTNRFVNPRWNTFTLSNSSVDTSTLRVTVTQNGQTRQLESNQYTYDATLNIVFVPGVPTSGGTDLNPIIVEIYYCPQTCSGLGCGGGIGV